VWKSYASSRSTDSRGGCVEASHVGSPYNSRRQVGSRHPRTVGFEKWIAPGLPALIAREVAIFSAFFDMNVYPVLDIEEAARIVVAAVEFRQSV
jgi:hypothetical protein